MVAVSSPVATCNDGRMSLWWLTYNRNGRLHGVVIIEAASLITARIGVADNALDKGTSFAEGHELAAARSARIPPGYVCMMLSRKEAAAMLDGIEGG
jgi:hypothetical protein